MAPYGDARRAPVWASWHICRVYENVFPLLSNLYGPVRMLVVRGITRLSREFVAQTKLEGTMAPRGLFEKPMSDLDDGSKGGTGSIMVFRPCGCNHARYAYLYRRRRQKRGTEDSAVEHRVSGS
jgi:hypothetical protein